MHCREKKHKATMQQLNERTGVRAHDIPKSKILYVLGHDVGHSDTVIRTTHGEVMDLIDGFQSGERDAQEIMVGSLRFIHSKNTSDTNRMFNQRNTTGEWTEFSNAIVDHFCARHVAMGTPIPMIDENDIRGCRNLRM